MKKISIYLLNLILAQDHKYGEPSNNGLLI